MYYLLVKGYTTLNLSEISATQNHTAYDNLWMIWARVSPFNFVIILLNLVT